MVPQRFVAVVLLSVAVVQACSFSTSSAPSRERSAPAMTIPPLPASVQPGGVIAFRRYADDSLTTSWIVTSRLDGTQEKPLTSPSPGVRDTLPAWSLDGKQVAFQRTTPAPDATAEVYVVGAAGGQIRQLTHSQTGTTCGGSGGPQPAAPTSKLSCNGDPTWSPDGKTLAYSHRYDKDSVTRVEIWVTNEDGGAAHALTAGGRPVEGSGPAWSPDGKQIALERGADNGTSAIFLVNADGTGERQISAPQLSFGDHPAWSPDGSKILFRSNPDDPTQGFQRSDLYTVHPDGTGLTKLTQSTRDDEFLSSSWSPDSQWIVTGLVQRGSHHDQAQLYLLNTTASQGRALLPNPHWQSAPRWSPGTGN